MKTTSTKMGSKKILAARTAMPKQSKSRIGPQSKQTKPAQFDASAKTVWEIAEEVFGDVPPEAWEKVPKDLSINLDHYLYGTPKREP